MKSRQPTLEERKLWRESNKGVRRLAEDEREAEPTLETSTEPTTKTATRPLASTPKRAAPPQPKTELAMLSTREAAKRFRSYPVQATLDLHGETKLDARARVQQFIMRQHHAGWRHVVIITGKGKGGAIGVLRANLPDWLNEPALRPLISAIAHAAPEKGGAGVTHVLLKAR